MKKYIILVLVVLLIGALTIGVMGKAKVAHLYLYQKTWVDPSVGDYQDVDGGAWGKMKYNLAGETFDFVFNGHGLVPEMDYTLIYYPDPWPGTGLICLGEGTVNGGGEIHIANSLDTGVDLPILGDWNAETSTTTLEDGSTGAKIFLVPSDDVDCEGQEMVGWTGPWSGNIDGENIYLFEDELITFDDTDD
ncbi:MAG: hypothetical protein WBC45_06095 [Atribacterota bacterium]